MAFGKKNSEESKDEVSHDYLRFPMGTRITATATGKLSISFAGDVSIGESLPDLGELSCGRNLSFDPGVTLNSDRIEVKKELEISPGCKLNTEHIRAEKLACKRSTIDTKTIDAITIECESTNITADSVTAKENIYLDKGDLEIGTITAEMLTLTKGTQAHIMIADVNKLDGWVQKGGYTSFNELLTKLFLYRPDLLNDQHRAEAAKMLNVKDDFKKSAKSDGKGAPAGDTQQAEVLESHFPEVGSGEPTKATQSKLVEQMGLFRKFYAKGGMPKEVEELCAYIEKNDMDGLKKNLNPCYQKLAVNKIPNEVMEIFYNIQRILKEESRMKRDQNAAT